MDLHNKIILEIKELCEKSEPTSIYAQWLIIPAQYTSTT
jgi:hypothetical protein